MNPIEPRFLKEHRFDVFYLNSEKGAIGESIHEIVHFMWFYVWNQLFGDDYDEYERPSLNRLSSINPYFPGENGGCIYPCFFDMKVNGVLIPDTLNTMYKSQSIENFMRNSFAYCKEHETEIREHMIKSNGAV